MSHQLFIAQRVGLFRLNDWAGRVRWKF